jgi:hypothetical protein
MSNEKRKLEAKDMPIFKGWVGVRGKETRSRSIPQ